jgi:CBS domain-containing protein
MKKIKAADFMTKKVIAATEDLPLTEVIELLVKHNISFLPVLDAEQNFLGVITEYDVINFASSGEADRTKVKEAMSRQVVHFSPEDNFETIVNECLTKRIHRAPIIEGGKVVGIVSRRDILRQMLNLYSHH